MTQSPAKFKKRGVPTLPEEFASVPPVSLNSKDLIISNSTERTSKFMLSAKNSNMIERQTASLKHVLSQDTKIMRLYISLKIFYTSNSTASTDFIPKTLTFSPQFKELSEIFNKINSHYALGLTFIRNRKIDKLNLSRNIWIGQISIKQACR